MPELKSAGNVAPCINGSKRIYYDLRKRETNQLAMNFIASSYNGDCRWICQPKEIAFTAENFITCISIKMTSQILKILNDTWVNTIETIVFLTCLLFDIHS